MLGTRYTFVFSSPMGVPVIDGIFCLSDTHARQMASWRQDVLRILDGRRQVWPRPDRPLHDEGADSA